MARTRIMFSNETKEVFSFLAEKSLNSKKEQMLFKAIMKKIELIKKDAHYGNSIQKKLIPKEYKLRHRINSLFWVKLPCS